MKVANKTKNEWWFFLSIFIAMVLWVIVINVENPTENVTIRNIVIEIINEDALFVEHIMYYGMEEKDLTVRFSGSKLEVDKIRNLRDEIKGVVDLSEYERYEAEEGTFNKYLPIEIDFPNSFKTVKLESQSMDMIKVYVDELAESNQEIVYGINGSLEKNYEIKNDSIKILPSNITLTGPKGLIRKVKEARIIIDITNRVDRMPIAVHIYDERGEIVNNIKLSQETVTVQYDIVKKKEVKLIADIVNTIQEDLNLIDIKMEPSAITILGDERVVDEFPNDLHVKVEINNKEGKYNTKEKISLPKEVVELGNIDEIFISYEIRR